MKKQILIGFLAIMLAGMVYGNPATGFTLNKEVIVTGDWKYDSGWINGNFPTATYQMNVNSPLATVGNFMQNENLGTAWKYQLEAQTQTNAITTFNNNFQAWTINDPETTPATGGYSSFQFIEQTQGQYSSSSLTVNGLGQGIVNSNVVVNSPAMDYVFVKVN